MALLPPVPTLKIRIRTAAGVVLAEVE